MLRLAIATVALALTGTSALASSRGPLAGSWQGEAQSSFQATRALQPNQSLTGATSRPSNRDMRMAPPIGGGRMNSGMGRR